MDARRWQRIEDIYSAVSTLDEAARERELDARCATDAAHKREIETLLGDAYPAQLHFARLAAAAGSGIPEAEAVLRHEGARIGAYRLIRQLGRGGMGVVYLAERADAQFDKQVALKVLPLGLVTPEARHRFQREREILAGLEHPNIARLLDGGITDEGTPYYVMEYVAGEPLDVWCRRRDLSVAQCLALFDRVCQAVAYAHGKLVVHRDVKPDNILVGEDGRPRLLDFGVAKLLDAGAGSAATVTGAEARLLSPAYAAPELVQGDAVTTACDVYSLAAAWQEMGNYARAEPLIIKALALTEDQLGADLWRVCLLTANQAELRLFDNRADSALDLARQAQTCFGDSFAPGHPFILVTRAMEGGALTRLGRHHEALEVLKGLPERIAPILGEADPNLANARAWLGETLVGLGRADDARVYLEAAYKLRVEQLGTGNPRTQYAAKLLERK